MTEIKTKPGCRTTPAGTEPIIPTAISDVQKQTDAHNATFYDLQGRRLVGQPTTKGLYIRNGKVFVSSQRP